MCRQHPFLKLQGVQHHAAAVREKQDQILVYLPVIFLELHIIRGGRELRLGLLMPNQLVQLQTTHQQRRRIHLHNLSLDQSSIEMITWVISER